MSICPGWLLKVAVAGGILLCQERPLVANILINSLETPETAMTKEALAKSLAASSHLGRVAAMGPVLPSASSPGLNVHGVGPISLPITAGQARGLSLFLALVLLRFAAINPSPF